MALIVASAAYTYVRTGDAGLALKSLGYGFAGLAVGMAIGPLIGSGIQAIADVSQTAAQAIRFAQVGYAGYGVYGSIQSGNPFAALQAGLGMAAAAEGFAKGFGDTDTRSVVNGIAKKAEGSVSSGGKTITTTKGGTPAEQARAGEAVNKVLSTKRGQVMVSAAEARGESIEIHLNNEGRLSAEGNRINLDLDAHPMIETTAGSIPASTERILGHELGHAVFGTRDAGPGRMQNVLENENPIAEDLGEPARIRY